ncbi:MAG: N-6 DNA methylase [Armatimonadetes bacterium]|nr:N-6 DNA methylase [Armatimonadota bacterium]
MAKKKARNSEYRLYDFINQSLAELGWNIKNPARYSDGEVYTQHECSQNHEIKKTLGRETPENIVSVGEDEFWVIEAKSEFNDISKAVGEAKDYAEKINKSKRVNCRFATGIAGDSDSTFLVETWFLSGDGWEKITINDIELTGFISKGQTERIIERNNHNLSNEEIPDALFLEKANNINDILHEGAITKKNRAKVIASLLLSLVEDPYFRVLNDPTLLIEDINSRVRALLRQHEKETFAQEIAISLPTSKDNHKKNKAALARTIQELRSLNIRSAINSGKDVLGQFYEVFLKYANDSKEIGIVLTPRHITKFSAQILGITMQDYIYDPTCGTGGFLVSALDMVKQSLPRNSSIDTFKESHIYGIEQEPEVMALALVNMIFRQDGKSNIYEGNCFDNYLYRENGKVKRIKKDRVISQKKKGIDLERFITKTLMNPPFALYEKEYEFVDHAIDQMIDGGLLFAILPTSVMTSSNNNGKEYVWRQKLLEKHTLKAVIKLSEDLFQPNAHKGTYAVIIETWKPHNDSSVFWAIMDDGYTMKKAKRLPSETVPSNIDFIQKELKQWLLAEKPPNELERVIGYTRINHNSINLDLSPEHHMPFDSTRNVDFSLPIKSLRVFMLNSKENKIVNVENNIENISVKELINNIERGDCKPLNSLQVGDVPVVTTTEQNNGVSGFYNPGNATIFQDKITIPANGSKYKAFYHPYKFTAGADILVCSFKNEYDITEMKLYFCSVYNKNDWRFSYFRKCTEDKMLDDISIPMPTNGRGKIDLDRVIAYISDISEYKEIIEELENEQSKLIA